MAIFVRGTDDVRALLPGQRLRYEVWQDTEPVRSMTLHELDVLLDGRHKPADFWATAAAAYDAGDREAVIDYPGYRRDHPPGPSRAE